MHVTCVQVTAGLKLNGTAVQGGGRVLLISATDKAKITTYGI